MGTPVAKKSKTLTFAEKRAAASRQERSIPVCLAGALVGQVEALDLELVEARKNAQTLGAQGDVRKLAERIQSLREQMESLTEVFRLRGLSRPENVKLKADHPPRQGNKVDEQLGFNEETYYPALIHACLVEPAMTVEEWTELQDELAEGEFTKLGVAAWQATTGAVSIPFSLAASAVLRNSDATSQPQSA